MRISLVASQLAHFVKYKYYQGLIFRRPKVSNQAVREYLLKIAKIYKKSSKKEKGNLLNHAQLVCELSRKHLIRCLCKGEEALQDRKRSGAKPKYPKNELLPHLKYLWISMERISPKRLKAAMNEWLLYYHECPVYLKIALQQISISTIGRYLKEVRSELEKNQKGLCSTVPARHMKNKVPINTLDSQIDRPGFTQADTVAHCGTALVGQFANTLTLTDIFSTWTENRAMLSKQGKIVRRSFADIDNKIPFTIFAINVDSGTEFLNETMLNFTRITRIRFTRSRPYKKNDNCYVEQKNYTHVRELFGYQRIETQELVDLMNDIYENCWNPLQNFFLPNFKLREKVRIGGKIKKKYDTPKTPYQRLIDSKHMTEAQKQNLRDRKKQLNPFELKKQLEHKLSNFFSLLNLYNKRKEHNNDTQINA